VPELPTADDLIRILQLTPHPEGGYFRETYRSPVVDAAGRAASTLIYFLLPRGHVSRLHRIDADESWHLYLGGPLLIHELDAREPAAPVRVTTLGSRLDLGERPQHVVPAGCWFGAEPGVGADYALVGCAVAPGFQFEAFELGDRQELAALFPSAGTVVERLS